mmetsp:Transcript_10777/g.21622  ORF Transcript_10777/g.21622 Transcript_10777/m.21622 type:complete len:109 (-) Transcript_10777:2543-2869(-)
MCHQPSVDPWEEGPSRYSFRMTHIHAPNSRWPGEEMDVSLAGGGGENNPDDYRSGTGSIRYGDGSPGFSHRSFESPHFALKRFRFSSSETMMNLPMKQANLLKSESKR